MPTIDYYANVPRGIEDNLRYRRDVKLRSDGNERFQRQLFSACRDDFCFWLGSFCWLYEPRPRTSKVSGRVLPKQIPFVPWEHQLPVIHRLREVLGFEDVVVEKSRGEGLSWILVYLALHDWLFDPQSKVGFVSRSEEEADDAENMDSLFAKIDWALSKLPRWMAGTSGRDWKRNLTKHSLSNFRNGAQINADAATGAVFRGGRLKWAALDEFAFFKTGEDAQALASSQGATDSRLFISTVNGTGNEFYRLATTPSGRLKIIVDWKDNPSKNRGLYRLVKGVPRAVDPANNPLLPEYDPPTQEVIDLFSRLRFNGFKLEASLRAPWYDKECDRAGANPQRIAQELDRDYGGSMHRIFGNDFLDKAQLGVRPATVRGDLSYHPETLEGEFDRQDDGPMELWCSLDYRQRPPARPYVVGVDVSAGLGGAFGSNSVIEVLDLISLEQVFEFASPTVPPADLADLAIAIAKWFHTAYLSWESNGPGRAFTKQMISRGYGNVYYRRNPWVRGEKRTKELGWASSPDTKEAMFSEILRSMLKGELTVHSNMLVKEFSQYVRVRDGTIKHLTGDSPEDGSVGGKAHGDRVIALGVALIAARDRPQIASKNPDDHFVGAPPPNSMAARKREFDLAQEDRGGDWDDRDNSDLAAGGRGPHLLPALKGW